MKERLYQIVLAQHVTEKAATNGQYVFKVRMDANKKEIKEAVEQLFEVQVEKVCVQRYDGKKKMFRRMPGVRKRWKKACLRLAEGHSIELGTES